jgi:hypothetical protein
MTAVFSLQEMIVAEILTEEWAAQEWLKLNWRDVESQARKAIRSALTSHEKFIEVFREHMPAEDFSLAMAEIRERNKPIQNFCTVCGEEIEFHGGGYGWMHKEGWGKDHSGVHPIGGTHRYVPDR